MTKHRSDCSRLQWSLPLDYNLSSNSEEAETRFTTPNKIRSNQVRSCVSWTTIHSPTHQPTQSPTHSITHPLNHPPTQSPTRSSTDSPTHWTTRPPTHSLTHSLTQPLTHPPTHSLTYPFTHLLIHSPIHLPIQPLAPHSSTTHSLTDLLIYEALTQSLINTLSQSVHQ